MQTSIPLRRSMVTREQIWFSFRWKISYFKRREGIIFTQVNKVETKIDKFF